MKIVFFILWVVSFVVWCVFATQTIIKLKNDEEATNNVIKMNFALIIMWIFVLLMRIVK